MRNRLAFTLTALVASLLFFVLALALILTVRETSISPIERRMAVAEDTLDSVRRLMVGATLTAVHP